ncbi:MAG: response regulator [Cyanobacteriota bacterium]
MEKLKVLLLEDNQNDMELIKMELLSFFEYDFEFKWVILKNDFTEALKSFNPDIVLSDFNLPQFNGLNAFKISNEIDPYRPFIIITGALSEESAADCIKAGVWDYVVKERLVRLPIAFENALKLKTEKLKNRSSEEEIKLIRSKTDIQLKLLYDAIYRAPSSIVITDINANIIFVNPEFEKVTGYKREEVVGKNPRVLQSGKHDKDFYKNMWDILLSGKEWKGELLNKKKNNGFYWESASIAPIYDEDGIIKNFVAVKHDITELVKAKEIAEESNRLKSNFLATISHELRTPLNTILGFSSFINEKTPIDEILDMNNKITESSNHLLEIVESILDISIIEAKELKLNKEICNISEIFTRIKHYLDIEQIRTKKGHINIKFVSDSDYSNLKINTDKIRIVQIISNLLNNALKFTEKGSIEYGYKVENKDITFFVKDTGIGIDEDKLNFIFDKFRQIQDSKSRKYSGVGLGLSISKEITNLLGSPLNVESKKGVGSKFFFSLPNIITIEEKDKKLISKSEFSYPDLENKMILIAEDTDLNYMVLKKMLAVTKASILWAKDGQQAIDMVKSNNNIEIILMDIMMPNVDGYEATIEIKKIRPDIYIIAQTAHTMESEIQKVFESGCDFYISKPIKKEILYDSLEKGLNKDK